MRLLSNIIKSENTNGAHRNSKTIQLSRLFLERETEGAQHSDANPVPILKRAEIEANNIRKQAEDEAEKMRREVEREKEQAKQEIEEALATAKQQGYDDGYEAGLAEGRQRYEAEIDEAKAVVASVKKARQERMEETEKDMLDLAVHVAGKIIGTKLSEDEDRWLDMVKQAIREVKEYEEIRLVVHHKWYDYIRDRKKELQALLKQSAELYIYPDATGDERTCIIEYPFGRIDAGIDSQLSEIKNALAAKLEENEDERSQPDRGARVD